jgi:hypothetical protein
MYFANLSHTSLLQPAASSCQVYAHCSTFRLCTNVHPRCFIRVNPCIQGMHEVQYAIAKYSIFMKNN